VVTIDFGAIGAIDMRDMAGVWDKVEFLLHQVKL
jgi:hypothetical protein